MLLGIVRMCGVFLTATSVCGRKSELPRMLVLLAEETKGWYKHDFSEVQTIVLRMPVTLAKRYFIAVIQACTKCRALSDIIEQTGENLVTSA